MTRMFRRALLENDKVSLTRKKIYALEKSMESVRKFDDYQKMTDKQHLSKVKNMPIKFLKASGKGFFIEKEGYALAIREEVSGIIEQEVFRRHMKDILEYRTMEYYRRRYTDN